MTPFDRTDILIVGAGIAGLATAERLHRAGMEVALVDAGRPAGESTWAGGGIVSAVPPWNYPHAVNQLVARSRALFPELVARLQASTGIDCEYRSCGLLLLMEPGEAGRAWVEQAGDSVRRGPVSEFEPALADGGRECIRLDGIAQVRNPRLGRALVEYLDARQVPIRSESAVARLLLAGDAITGVELEDGTCIRSEAVILAAGAWTDRILENTHLDPLGIYPVRGQMLLFNPGRQHIDHIVNTGAGYLIPRADHRILAGSTVEEVGFDRRPTVEAYRAILEAATGILPALSEDQLECQWLGFRPGIGRDVPAIGIYPGLRGLWINSGGYRNGLGMAPAAAELLLRQLQGGPLSEAFEVVPQ